MGFPDCCWISYGISGFLMDFLWDFWMDPTGWEPTEPLRGAQGAQAQPQPAADGLLLLWAEALRFASRCARINGRGRPTGDRVKGKKMIIPCK